MKIKRIISLIIVSTMLITAVFTLSSCGGIISAVKNVISAVENIKNGDGNENEITGALDIKYANGNADPYDEKLEWEPVEGTIFNGQWEPGYAVVKHIMVTNISDQSGIFMLKITPEDEKSKLPKVIDVYYFAEAQAVTSGEELVNGHNLGTVAEMNSNKSAISVETKTPVKGDSVEYIYKDYIVNENNNFSGGFVTSGLSVMLNVGETKIITVGLMMRDDAGIEYSSMDNYLGFSLSVGAKFAVYIGDDSAIDEEGNDRYVEVTYEDVMAAAMANKFTLTNAEVTLSETDYKKLQRPNRPVADDGETKLYVCESADNFALQTEAFDAFNAFVTAFYQKTKLTTIYVKVAYNVTGGNASYFTNALAVKLDYVTDTTNYTTATTYGAEDYEWLYEHAHEYGFVRVSDNSGEENIFRYVGLAHAKYIESKQGKNDETFYGLESYLADIKATTPDSTMKIGSVKKAIGETSTTTFYVYYMPSASAVFKLPNNKYTYTVSAADDGGYIVTYRKADKA